MQSQKPFVYPHAHQEDVVDNYHGTAVADPFRWLEEPDSVATQRWVAQQNSLTRDFIDEHPIRATIHKRLTHLWNYKRQGTPIRRQNNLFFQQNDGLQDQAVLFVQTDEAPPRPFLDPNQFTKDGTAAITSLAINRDGSKVAYGISLSGSDGQLIRIRDVVTGQDHDEVLHWCRFASIAWRHDSQGFFYNRDPEPQEGETTTINPLYNRLYWHQLGTPQAEDILVYHRPDAPELNFPPTISDDGTYIILYVWHAAISKNRLYYRHVNDIDGAFIHLIDDANASYRFIGNHGPTFYVQTDWQAPNGRIVAIDLHNPAREQWQTLIPEQTDPIASCQMINNQFVIVRLHHAHHQIHLYDLNGEHQKQINLPTIGSVTNISGHQRDKECYISFTSFLHAGTIFHYDFTSQQLTTHHRPNLSFDPTHYQTRQIFYHSKDGTRVPMFLIHKKDLVEDGNNPTLLTGYGGFNVSRTPLFSATTVHWLESGGVYALANLRGGNEYGEAWHEAGMLAHKQNVFDDFIAAAEWLVSNHITRPQKVGIMGGSNGGLLVAACMLQRPSLFGAVVCNVPVIDMLRYHQFTAGRYWVAEYGNAETNPDHFQFLMAYSPLHNIKPNTTYPPLLITTADTDDRVVPMHAKKFAASLQTAVNYQSSNPILLRVETRAGHGLGKPITKVIDESSDIYTFLWSTLIGE